MPRLLIKCLNRSEMKTLFPSNIFKGINRNRRRNAAEYSAAKAAPKHQSKRHGKHVYKEKLGEKKKICHHMMTDYWRRCIKIFLYTQQTKLEKSRKQEITLTSSAYSYIPYTDAFIIATIRITKSKNVTGHGFLVLFSNKVWCKQHSKDFYPICTIYLGQ